MQYILTEEEYAELKREHSVKAKASVSRLQEVCTLAARHIPIVMEWDNDKTPRPWGCILGPREQDPGYCDDCPVEDICPSMRKEFSK